MKRETFGSTTTDIHESTKGLNGFPCPPTENNRWILRAIPSAEKADNLKTPRAQTMSFISRNRLRRLASDFRNYHRGQTRLGVLGRMRAMTVLRLFATCIAATSYACRATLMLSSI